MCNAVWIENVRDNGDQRLVALCEKTTIYGLPLPENIAYDYQKKGLLSSIFYQKQWGLIQILRNWFKFYRIFSIKNREWFSCQRAIARSRHALPAEYDNECFPGFILW
jgi:hypothetical protein